MSDIVERLRKRAAYIERWNNTSSPERHEVLEVAAVETIGDFIKTADEIESLRAQLAAAEASKEEWKRLADILEDKHRRMVIRAGEAEAQLASATKALKPYKNLADRWPNQLAINGFIDLEAIREFYCSLKSDGGGK